MCTLDHLMARPIDNPLTVEVKQGILQEVLLGTLIARLERFQSGPYADSRNAEALSHLKSAQQYLHARPLDRMARGVEGTHQV